MRPRHIKAAVNKLSTMGEMSHLRHHNGEQGCEKSKGSEAKRNREDLVEVEGKTGETE